MKGWLRWIGTPFAIFPAILLARVFETQPRPTTAWDRFGHWQCAYRTPLVVNGKPITLEIWNAPESLAAACSRIESQARTEGQTLFWLPGSDAALGVLAASDHLLQLLAMAMESGRQTMIFAFRRDHAAPTVSSSDLAIPDGIPAPPGAILRFHVRNPKSRTTTIGWETFLPPDQVRAFMAGGLLQNGWQPAVPGSAGHPLALYLKEDALCTLSAELSGQEGRVLLTVLHHRMGNATERSALPWRAAP